jgi:glutamyl-tRNA reductase
MSAMHLDRLVVVHQRRSDGARGDEWLSPPPSVLHVETCLRRLCIGDVASLPNATAAGLPATQPVERFRGVAAYEFLLRVASGLESEIAGESEIFGQFKDAWRAFQQAEPARARTQGKLVQKLFEDVKEIRARHLQNADTITYGGLTRHLLGPAASAPTLVIGAGNMAQSVVPYLAGRPLHFWNRTVSRAHELAQLVPSSQTGRADPVILAGSRESELDAWRTAANVVVCVPPDADRDAPRLRAWQQNPNRRRLVHLGVIDPAGTPWEGAPELSTLRDLFAMQSVNSKLRTAHIERARAACREKAQLRGLGGPASLAHGWEDLSVFASTA